MTETTILPRAPRLPLKAPITFRTSPAQPWVEGVTVNISRSGVLFALKSWTDINGDLEFVINLSRGAMQGPGVALLPDLHCRGRVVRVSAGPEGQSMIAASIRRQSLKKVGAPPNGGGAPATGPADPATSQTRQ